MVSRGSADWIRRSAFVLTCNLSFRVDSLPLDSAKRLNAMKKSQLKLVLPVMAFAMLAGCSANLAEIAATVQNIKAKEGASALHLTSLNDEGNEAASEIEPSNQTDLNASDGTSADAPKGPAEHAPAYPQRKNPFEFAVEVDVGQQSSTLDASQELKLFGFAGSAQPKAIIHIGQNTRLMSQGDRWGDLEVLEINPPEVRMRANGVIRTWSLLGHDSSK